MSNLKSTIESLAAQFAGSIIEALRRASIDELSEVTQGGVGRRTRARGELTNGADKRRGRGGRLGRRSPEAIAKMVDAIVELLAKSPEGLRAEQIKDALGCEAKELPRPLADALREGRVTKSGQKRATTYFAGAEGARRRPRSGGRRKRARS